MAWPNLTHPSEKPGAKCSGCGRWKRRDHRCPADIPPRVPFKDRPALTWERLAEMQEARHGA
jgi:hypothetical protein